MCNELLKNETQWLKHSKREEHIQGLKLLKEKINRKEDDSRDSLEDNKNKTIKDTVKEEISKKVIVNENEAREDFKIEPSVNKSIEELYVGIFKEKTTPKLPKVLLT